MASHNFPTTTKEWRKQLQATAPEGEHRSLVYRFARFVSIYPTILLARTPLTPNMITSISVVLFLLGFSLFALDNSTLHLVGVGLVFLYVVLDQCDGEIARLKGNPSKSGAYVEPLSHDIQFGFMFIPVTLGLYWAGYGVTIIYVGFLATIFKLLYRLIEERFLGLNNYLGFAPKVSANTNDSNHKRSFLRSVYFYIHRDVFSSLVLPLLVFTLLGRMDIFVWMFAAWFGMMFVFRFTRQVLYVSRLHLRFRVEGHDLKK